MYEVHIWAQDKPPDRYTPYTKSDTGATVFNDYIQLDKDLDIPFHEIEYFGYQFRMIYFQPKKSNTRLPKYIYISGRDSDLHKLALELQTTGLKPHSRITEPGRKIFLRKIMLLVTGLTVFCLLIILLLLLTGN